MRNMSHHHFYNIFDVNTTIPVGTILDVRRAILVLYLNIGFFKRRTKVTLVGYYAERCCCDKVTLCSHSISQCSMMS